MSRWPKPQHDDHCWLVWCGGHYRIVSIRNHDFYLHNPVTASDAVIFWPAFNFNHYAQEARNMIDQAYPLMNIEFATRDPYYKGKPRTWLVKWLDHYARCAAHYHTLSTITGSDVSRAGFQQTAANCTWLALGFRLELVARGRKR